METLAVLERLLATLECEEACVLELLRLASREHEALVDSDYDTLTTVTEAMHSAAERLEALEGSRESLLVELDRPGAGLNELVQFAEHHGMNGFAVTGERLRSVTRDLQEAQEHNARLILSAVALRERWLAMLTRLTSPTYGPDGPGLHPAGHQVLSRSA